MKMKLLLLFFFLAQATAAFAVPCTEIKKFEGDLERSDVLDPEQNPEGGPTSNGVPSACGPYAQLRFWPKFGALTFNSHRQFWHRGRDAEFDSFIDPDLPTSRIGGKEYPLDQDKTFFVQTTFESGRVETLSSRVSQPYFYAALDLRCEKDGSFTVMVKYASADRWCRYTRKSSEDLVARGIKRVEYASNEMTAAARDLLGRSNKDLENFCSQMRDPWWPASSNYPRICDETSGMAIRQRIENFFQTALQQLAKEKGGIQAPLKTFGETFSSDRLYRKKTGKAVFDGYDPVSSYWSSQHDHRRDERCKDQGRFFRACALFGAVAAADVIGYHKDSD